VLLFGIGDCCARPSRHKLLESPFGRGSLGFNADAHVRIQTRYAPAIPSQFGFKTIAGAEAFIEAEKAKHRPGRRKKVAA